MPEYNPESYNAVFARMEQKLDDIQNDVKEIKLDNSKLRERVISLENFKYYLVGFTSIISSFITLIIAKFWNGSK